MMASCLLALACVLACVSSVAADKFPGFEFGTPLPASVRESGEERFTR